jgi:hypothetical protein
VKVDHGTPLQIICKISTKVTKGRKEILNDIQLGCRFLAIKKGEFKSKPRKLHMSLNGIMQKGS